MDGQTRGAGPSFWLLVPRGTMFVKVVDTTLTLEVKDAIQFFCHTENKPSASFSYRPLFRLKSPTCLELFLDFLQSVQQKC